LYVISIGEAILTIRAIVRPTIHPALIKHAEERARNVQNRIADTVTRFAGSMPFVYVHLVWFVIWIASGV